MIKELLPCPFCGEDKFIAICEPDFFPFGENYNFARKCVRCGSIGKKGKTRELADKYWNTRLESNNDE